MCVKGWRRVGKELMANGASPDQEDTAVDAERSSHNPMMAIDQDWYTMIVCWRLPPVKCFLFRCFLFLRFGEKITRRWSLNPTVDGRYSSIHCWMRWGRYGLRTFLICTFLICTRRRTQVFYRQPSCANRPTTLNCEAYTTNQSVRSPNPAPPIRECCQWQTWSGEIFFLESYLLEFVKKDTGRVHQDLRSMPPSPTFWGNSHRGLGKIKRWNSNGKVSHL